MTEKEYKDFKNLIKSVKGASKSDTLQRQIDNKKTRLKAGGVDVKEDKRNVVEKALGLPDDQNIVFDIFELLGRPQQALFGAINAKQNDEDAGKAAWEHFKGDKDTNFKKILTDAGMKDRKGKLDLADVLGFGGDVFLDPMDVVPVAGFSKFKKALDAGDNIKDASKLLKSGTDLAFEGAGKALKGTVKAADKGIEGGLKFLDKTKGVQDSAGDIVKLAYETPMAKSAANLGKKTVDGLATNAKGRFELYKDLKDSINKAFNYSSVIPKKTADIARKSEADNTIARLELGQLSEELNNDIMDYAKKISKDKSPEAVEKVAKQLDQDIHNLKEFTGLNREVTGKELIKEALNGKLSVIDAGNDGLNLLNRMANDVNGADVGLKLLVEQTDDGFVKLNDDWNKLGLGKKGKAEFFKDVEGLDEGLLLEKITKNGNYTQEDLDEFGKILKKRENDKEFQELYDKVEDVFNRANKIVDKNYGTDMIKKYGDNEGYVRHAFEKDQFDNLKEIKFVDKYGEVTPRGKTSILSDRKYNMSAREANNMFRDSISKNYDTLSKSGKAKVDEMLGKGGIFKEGIMASFDDYMENIPKLAKDSELINGVLVDSTFGNFDELKNIEKELKKATNNGDTKLIEELKVKKVNALDNSNMKILSNKDNVVPRGFKQLNRDEVHKLSNKLTKMGDDLGIPKMKSIAKKISTKGDKLAINEELLRLIDISSNKNETKAFTRMYDKFLNVFKRNKVLSPTFQMNNVIGNMSNMYLAGISPTEQAKLFPEAADVLRNGQSLLLKASQGAKLTEKESKMLDVWNGFIKTGFGDPKTFKAMDLADMPESLKEYFKTGKAPHGVKEILKDGLPYLNNKANNYMDTLSRLVTYMEGSRNPGFLKRLGVENAGEAIRKINFDPTELTQFEKNTMKRLMPFYTFTKKNLAFQVHNLSKNGSQYHKLIKGYNNLLKSATGGNEENVADWLKNNLYVPIPALGKDGSYKFIRASLPFGNLIDTVDDPLGTLTGLTTPVIKAPFELKTNTNSFTGAPIERFDKELSKNIPGLTKKQEFLLGNLTGLDVPLKGMSRAYQGIQETMQEGGNPLEAIGKGLANTSVIENNINTDKMNKMYEELDELETLMQQYKQRGYEFSTINELRKANNNPKLDKVNASLSKLYGIQKNPYQEFVNKVK